MAVISFRLDEDQAREVRSWAERRGIAPSELVRDAVRRYLIQLREDGDVAAWTDKPLSPEESSLRAVADWGPGEDWSDWKSRLGESQFAVHTAAPSRRLGGKSGGVKMVAHVPEALKKAIEEEARRLGQSEADVIRHAIVRTVARRRPRGDLYQGEPIADHAEGLLPGFGER